jgi:hypothetical protein
MIDVHKTWIGIGAVHTQDHPRLRQCSRLADQ